MDLLCSLSISYLLFYVVDDSNDLNDVIYSWVSTYLVSQFYLQHKCFPLLMEKLYVGITLRLLIHTQIPAERFSP